MYLWGSLVLRADRHNVNSLWPVKVQVTQNYKNKKPKACDNNNSNPNACTTNHYKDAVKHCIFLTYERP
jgi:hypothetical protein